MFYQAVKNGAAIFFNLLNIVLGGNLPPFGCVCIIVEQDQRFLVVGRPNGHIVFPGGFMRWHESPEHTVIREGEEETGLHLRPTSMIGHYPIISRRMDRMSTLNIAYQAEVVGGTLRGSIEGTPLWLSEEELREKLAFYYCSVFEDYLRARASKRQAHS